MTVKAQSFGKNVEHEQGKSAMAAAQEPSVEELIVGVQVPPRPPVDVDRLLSASSMTDWWDLLRASVGTELSQLHWGILSFCKAYELTNQQMQLRRDALDCVKRAVRDIWPSADVNLFGSTAIGLALPWSDIDVVIVPPKQQNLTFRKPTPMSWQNALSLKLNQLGQCLSLRSLPFAKVPILKVVFKSGIACDISFDEWDSEASVLVIRQFMRQHEPCRPLCLVLKFFLGQNNLNELHTGGLGSFCIFTMVISHLQKMASFEAAGCDLGTLLLSFFAYYSNIHNYGTDVVSTRADSLSSKLEKGWVNLKHPQLLAVEDPLDPTSDIAKGSHKIEEVREKFAQAQRVLLTHWYDEHVLAEIVDMTVNPNQRPAASSRKKANRSKKRRAAGGQDDRILPHQPTLKIQRIHHPPQGSGLVSKRQLDWILAKHEPPHFTSLSRSKRLRAGGHDLEKDFSEQTIARKTPSPHGTELCRRYQNNAILGTGKPRKIGSKQQLAIEEGCRPVRTVQFKPATESSMDVLVNKCSGVKMNNNVPRLCRRFTSDDLRMAAEQPSTQNDDVKSVVDLDFWEAQLTSRRKSRTGPLIHQSTKDVGKDVQPAEAIHLDFWEPQLTARQKSRSGSLIHQSTKDVGKNVQPAEAIHSEQSRHGQHVMDVVQDSKGIVRDVSEPHLTPKRPSRFGSFPEGGLEGETGHPARRVQEEGILIDFWEAHLSPRLKSQKSAVNIQRNTSEEAVEDPRSFSMDFVTEEGNGGALPIQSSDLDQPQDTGENVTGRSGDEKLLVDFWEALLAPKLKASGCLSKHLAAGREGDAQPVEKDRPEQQLPPQSCEGRVSPDERNLVDFWETHLNPKPKSRMGCSNNQHQAEEEQAEEHTDAVGSNGEGFDRILVDFWEAHLTPSLKSSRRGSLRDDAIAGEEDNQPMQKTLSTQGHQSFVGRSEEESILSTFWEACLNPAFSRKGYRRRNQSKSANGMNIRRGFSFSTAPWTSNTAV